MLNYAPAMAAGKNGIPIQNAPPPTSVLASYNRESGVASSVISVSHDTTMLEIAALGGSAAMRWVRTGDTQASIVAVVSGANFAHVIPTGTVRQFVIPIEAIGSSGASVQGVNRAEGLYQRVAIISAGAASSVLLTEY